MPKLLQSIRTLVGIHCVISALLTGLLWWFGDSSLGASFALGAAVMLISVVAMAWTTWRVMAQKMFALTAAIIVIKYAVLLGTLYFLSRAQWLRPLAVVVGVFSFMVSTWVFAIFEKKKN